MIVYENEEDCKLSEMIPFKSICSPTLDAEKLEILPGVEASWVFKPTKEHAFLHETAIISYHGILFASWYNCQENELEGQTIIRGKRSNDGGKTWSDVEVLAEDPDGKIMYCPPVYGICHDTLYLMVNQMVSADHIHSLDLYRFDEADGEFHFRWSKPIPFKLNTNVYNLENGKLLLAGRVGKQDEFPDTPAVLISDSGQIDADWRIVKLQENRMLPDGSMLIHPETSAIINGQDCVVFCRNDQRRVPLMYISNDHGEHWSGPIAHDVPFSNSKIYSGMLSNGASYIIGNMHPGRNLLAIFFTKPGERVFSHGGYLRKDEDQMLGAFPQWSYPVATEWNNHLYVIYTTGTKPRGAMLSVVPIVSGQ